ncbi:MAG: bifunctional 5-dehydro-2-deoxygluconokinase/5-dehydro-2-deoxyphosphogluconate aldolase [Candidatus Puniceispirillaceae bacterium]
MAEPTLDVICIGRSSVDLYGGQVGGRLEDMSSFAKYIGGSPTNISIGCARLGLKSAVITGVGDEHMGRFIREQLIREGVDISHVKTDPDRLTALVILGIRDNEQFPLIFYREDCADMAIGEADIDPDFIASAKAVLVTGTHFSTDRVAGASFAAMRLARQFGRKVAFDIDYRPNLWALGGHGDGESRFAESARVTAHLQTVLPHCDLIVGTEEEWHIAGGSTDTIAALQAARAITGATLVCKRGALGCVVFEGAITGWDDGVSSPVREIEVFNVLGAGDGFMSGFLSGWLRGASAADCALYANICGALAVSRHGCAPSYPSQIELQHMIETGSAHFALRKDPVLEQIHWSTTRRRRHDELLAFAFDHRIQFSEMAVAHGRSDADIDHFKTLALDAVTGLAGTRDGLGILVDDRLGRTALHAASDHDVWIGRPIEESGVFPLALEEGPDLGSRLAEWPVNHCVKVLAPLRTDDPADLIAYHEKILVDLADACRRTGHEFLLEIINGRADKPADPAQIHTLMKRIYELGIMPDWWKLEPVADQGFWTGSGDIVRAHDPHIQGIIVLGKEMPDDELVRVLAMARGEKLVRGFAIGRTIFSGAARQWFAGDIDDAAATSMMSTVYRRLIAAWDAAG